MKTKVRLLFPCYFAFLVNGALVDVFNPMREDFLQ